jgi:hypothetical protein
MFMKMKFTLFILLLLAINVATAQTNPPANADTAKIEFESTVYDFGKIEEGSPGKAVFIFKNTGTKPLVINWVKSSCGCLVPSYDREPVMPGKTGKITGHYDTKRIGPFTKALTVSTNSDTEIITLIIKGEVLKKEEDATPKN